LWCSMFYWVCKFLSMFHCALFHNSGLSYSFNSKGSTFFLGT
jgi:hypothetical protein